MSKWEFQPDIINAGSSRTQSLVIRRVDGTKALRDPVSGRVIASTGPTNFELLYNAQSRLCGYKLNFEPSKLLSKFISFNSCFLAFNDNPTVLPKLEILYEDQVVRLLCYEFDACSDVWLVGRWRE